MTPTEKATKLFYKFNGFNTYGLDKECCKKSATFLAEEIIIELIHVGINQDDKYGKDINLKLRLDYWNEVKEEIEKL